MLLIKVKDSGIGIPQDMIQKVFLPFHQIESVRKKTEGTGLGLTISQKLISLMGGVIRIESSSNVGTVFHLTIPMTIVNNDANIISDSSDSESPKSDSDQQFDRSDLPPKEDFNKLYDTAIIGDINGIKKIIKQMELDNPNKNAFLDKISSLADIYAIDEIVEIMKQYKS